MTFVARFTLPNTRLPLIGYIHGSGLAEAYGSFERAKQHAESIAEQRRLIYPIFAIAALRGLPLDKGDYSRIAEFFVYQGIKNWPGDPEVNVWVFADGVFHPNPKSIARGETIRMLGIEENHRQHTESLIEYLRLRPSLGDLEPRYDLGSILTRELGSRSI